MLCVIQGDGRTGIEIRAVDRQCLRGRPRPTKLGTIPLTAGTGWFGGGVPGLPPHPAKSAKPARIVIKRATRRSDFMEVP
jgi:hypothetical protein